ncbi:apolipoprotein N-acyltransferase [bacterium]|nr:apolipoprotein N-acyltransferase [bacterium]
MEAPYQLLADYLRLTNQALAALSETPDLIVWPEVAVTDVLRWRPDLRRALHGLVEDAGAPLLFGVLEADTDEADEDEIYNTLYLFSPGGGEQRYDKTHLVPWGETIPLGEALPWLKALVYSRGGGEMAAGRRLTRFQLPDGRVFGCLICFESTLPNLAARLVRGGAQFLVVATNDAWFFDTAALPQHLWAAQARALETRVPVLRAANTGITAGIDCTGRLVGRIPDQIPGTSLVEIALPTGRPLSGYALGGDGFGWLCLLACLGFVAVRSLGGRRA